MATILHPDYARGRIRPGTYYVGPVGASDPARGRHITAKYASKCPLCKGGITPGETVAWEPGRRAVHLACPSK